MRICCAVTGFIVLIFFSFAGISQELYITGKVTSEDVPVSDVNISISSARIKVRTDSAGNYVLPSIRSGTYTVEASAVGYKKAFRSIVLSDSGSAIVNFDL